MRQFVIDELSILERDNLESFLKRTLSSGPMAGIFWIELPEYLLAEAQRGHDQCGPYYLAVEIDEPEEKAGLIMHRDFGGTAMACKKLMHHAVDVETALRYSGASIVPANGAVNTGSSI